MKSGDRKMIQSLPMNSAAAVDVLVVISFLANSPLRTRFTCHRIKTSGRSPGTSGGAGAESKPVATTMTCASATLSLSGGTDSFSDFSLLDGGWTATSPGLSGEGVAATWTDSGGELFRRNSARAPNKRTAAAVAEPRRCMRCLLFEGMGMQEGC